MLVSVLSVLRVLVLHLLLRTNTLRPSQLQRAVHSCRFVEGVVVSAQGCKSVPSIDCLPPLLQCADRTLRDQLGVCVLFHFCSDVMEPGWL